MDYSVDEIMQYIEEEDVKFIRLAFCDVYGNQKNISIMPNNLERALSIGIPIVGSFIKGFGDEAVSDLYLHPDPSTISVLPWRPEHGRVIRMFCDITFEDGTPFIADTRAILKNSMKKAADRGIEFLFGSRSEFYLLKTNEEGEPTNEPHDNAGYMDIAPLDKGENVRREICLTLERMGITPFDSYHEAGPGQHEIDFVSGDPLKSADNTLTYKTVVNTIASRNGLFADFSPKPLAGQPGNGFHINFVISSEDTSSAKQTTAIAGVLSHIYDMTLFFNPTEDSYKRLGEGSAPKYISWSNENRNQLIRIPTSGGSRHYAQLRSADAMSNAYLMYALIIEAALDGIDKNMTLDNPVNSDFEKMSDSEKASYKTLPVTLEEAKKAALESDFVNSILSKTLIDSYVNKD